MGGPASNNKQAILVVAGMDATPGLIVMVHILLSLRRIRENLSFLEPPPL